MLDDVHFYWRKHLVWGLIFVALGVAVLLDQAGIITFELDLAQIWHYWPLPLALIGLAEIIPPTTPRYLLRGLWQIFLAAWWYVSFEHVWGLGFGQTWPALLVVSGMGMVARPLLDKRFIANKE